MQKKILSDQSLNELKRTEEKHISLVTIHIILLCIFIGIAIYFIVHNGFSLYSFLPLLYTPILIYALITLKKVKDEIKVRTSHMALQKRMEEMK